MKQEAYIKVEVLENEIEAQLLDSILNERGIPHHIQSYHDTAYDGLFQAHRGWGHVSAPADWSEEIADLLTEIREAQPHEREIRVFETAAAMSHRAAELIVALAIEAVEMGRPFTLALSGGSTPKYLFSLLATDTEFRKQMPWQMVHLFWGDERHVPPDDPSSNYGMTRETMLEKVPIPRVNVHPVTAAYSDPKKSANEYEELLRRYFRLEAGELPCFDCVLLGLGPDGHTASLFPGTKALYEREHLVVANWVERLQAYRITMTVPVLNNANHVIFLTAGENKAEILQEVLEGERDPERLPSQLIEPTHGRLVWLVDEAAAGKLTQRGP